ncbi:MAG: hypothetical protein AAGD09_22205, partial [Cyanobacteria bacterium P01_F01_bin.56]
MLNPKLLYEPLYEQQTKSVEKLDATSLLNLIKVQKWSFDACPTSPPAAPLLLKERLNDSLLPLLCKERLGEVLMA